QDAHPTRKNNSCGMGILPVPSIDEKDFCKRSIINQSFMGGQDATPQENLIFVEQASCLF
ncbi:hypothetical protein, partial [Microcoleus sp. OTE_8_concoct_300]|uniref:hypothetical protein n=1 Tax=Microcoleus sp. OTE_8_concoct_300 TaxID=2964710 RepID=UPI00403F3C5C